MAKILQNPMAIQDLENPVPAAPEDTADDVEEFDELGEFEEFEEYDVPGGVSMDEALRGVQAMLETETDPVKRMIYTMQKAGLEMKAGLDKMAEVDSQDSTDFEDDGLMEFTDYETPGGLSHEEALAKAKEAMENADNEEFRWRYAEQVAGLEQMGGAQMGGAQADIPEYSVPLSGPLPPPSGSKVLTFMPTNQGQGIVASITAGITKAVEGFAQQQHKGLEQLAKPDAVKEESQMKDQEKPANPKNNEKPAASKITSAPGRSRALPDLSGLKTGRPSVTLEMN